jgi:predicted membrane protein
MKIELFNAAFWGVILIIIGILLIIKYMFNIHFPIGRIVIAILFIYFGLRILIGHHGACCHMRSNTENSAAFTEQEFHYSPNLRDYKCAFGSCSLDLSDISVTENKTIEISAVFGEFRLKISKDANYTIQSNTAFGSTVSPDNSSYGFGQRTYYSPNYKEDLPHLTIKTNVAFGSIKIISE